MNEKFVVSERRSSNLLYHGIYLISCPEMLSLSLRFSMNVVERQELYIVICWKRKGLKKKEDAKRKGEKKKSEESMSFFSCLFLEHVV